jgi:hypothetical protein
VPDDGGRCIECARNREELVQISMRNIQLEAEVTVLQSELDEALKLIELQKADIDRYEKAIADSRPNCPERVPEEQLQLGMARVLFTHGAGLSLAGNNIAGNDADTGDQADDPAGSGRKRTGKKRHKHGRRDLEVMNLPSKQVILDPEEVRAAGGEGFRIVGQEVSSVVAYQHAGYVRVEFVRRKWARDDDASRFVFVEDLAGLQVLPLPPVVIAPMPDCVWPRFMADASAIANIALSKYGDCLPLHRQETISAREGFVLPRSTQCGWLGAAYKATYRIVDAMFNEARRSAFYIATDATGAPVKSCGGTDNWHVFVFVAEQDHVIFRYTATHDGDAISAMLRGYGGHVLADASSIYDILFRTGMTESGCWSHMRRYVWKVMPSDGDRACEGLSIISELFRVARECHEIPMPTRTVERAARAGPIIELFQRWIDDIRNQVDPRSPLDAAITYYDNQKAALHRFLSDGRLPIHNNVSERQLRNLVLGRNNWLYFANETGLKWYVTFRSLIASCALHDLNPQLYLEQVLRLAPHWPVTRMLELSPKYWTRTLSQLDERQRGILARPWELESQMVELVATQAETAA